MNFYRVISNTKESKYYFVVADLIEKGSIKETNSGKFEFLEDNDPTAKQMLREFSDAPVIDYEHLVCESEHYLFYASFRRHFYDWTIVKK